ncbi:unnamed protein product [Calypogeia fissa]
MGKAEMEAPLLHENGRVNEEGVARLGREVDASLGHGSAPSQHWRSRSIALVLAVCCIGAILLLSTSHDFKNSRLQTVGAGEQDIVQMEESEGDEGENLTYFTAQRTKYHFQPPDNFMSDPCAPMYYMGYYHIWYQWNPYGRTWGNMTWGHAVSIDLIHWKYLPISLQPDHWYDIQGTWSGYVTIVDDVPVVLYTGGRGLFGGDANQSISMALPVDPSDPLLREWKKVDANPLILTPEGFSSQAFRDPTTAWLEEGDPLWKLSIPSVVINPDGTRDGVGLMYTSSDFYNWTLQDTYLHTVKGTGTWECLDLFPTIPESELGTLEPKNPEYYHDGMKYVLKAGLDETRVDYYSIGTYSTKTHKWTPDDPEMDVGIGLQYDYGRFYASKTFYDTSKNRRVLWGYIHESDSEADDTKKGWACLLSIPRTVWLDPKTGKNVLQWPVEEVEALRGAHVSYKDIDLSPTDVVQVDGGDGQQLDVLVSFAKPYVGSEDVIIPAEDFDCRGGADNTGVFGPFGFLVLADENRFEHSDVFYYIGRKANGQWGAMVCHDQSRSSVYDGDIDRTVYGHYYEILESDEELTLRLLVDHSLVETFVQGGRFTFAARIYPTLAIGNKAKLFLFNNGTTNIKVNSLDVYQMGSVTMTYL